MKKIFTIAVLSGTLCLAQNGQAVEKPVRDLFLAMKTAGAQLMKTVFSETAILQTITKDGVKTEDINSFITSVSGYAKNDLDERIMIKAIHTDGDLASVFVPYSFYFKGKFSHCGANSFQLIKQNGIWKIQYLIDTRRKENCNDLK
ncbi:nuclear transport factor 2 family protein [Chryseobacterium sp. SSA4.19]|uniref:nuclear transport factor 2 family protein n=1 Tax=Chryseobacterium sp. SSA4.19 TaxID=2919915 RepID=UPI001F4EE0EA|nr:nuclear transport factor 2 family protein [Chryseobacterium sp. SSA4.19]MCJ8153152.1 nuclear transport factor 2 family protein [Chryseobacterium sp. SSA4.19]